MLLLRCALAAALGMVATGAAAGLPDRPSGPVLDMAGAIDPPAFAELDRLCRRIDASGKGVLVVAVVPSLEGDSIESYANRLFTAWGIGHGGRNDGVLLLVSMGDRKVRIETGYGVEALLPDGRCGEIIRRDITPKFKAGDPAGGVLAGAQTIAGILDGSIPGGRAAFRLPALSRPGMLIQVLCLLLGPVVVVFLLNRNWFNFRVMVLALASIAWGFTGPALAWLPLQIMVFVVGCVIAWFAFFGARDLTRGRRGRSRGGWFDGGSSGGGGFGGGGGGSFGGFSGGSSGGGGASGGW